MLKMKRVVTVCSMLVAMGAANAAPLPPVIGSGQNGAAGNQGQPAVRVSGQMVMDLYRQVEQLKREVSELRGELEELNYSVDGVSKRQRDIYLDLDRRLQPLETGGQGAVSDVTGSSTSTTAQTPETAGNSVIQQKSTNLAAERKLYQQAFDTLKEGHYSQAIEQFGAFLKKYPTGEYADNATYWLAETYYVTRSFTEAQGYFEKVTVSFPNSSKVADSLLKSGYIAYELKEWKKARAILTDLIKRFPDSSAARLAEKRLQRMKQENH